MDNIGQLLARVAAGAQDANLHAPHKTLINVESLAKVDVSDHDHGTIRLGALDSGLNDLRVWAENDDRVCAFPRGEIANLLNEVAGTNIDEVLRTVLSGHTQLRLDGIDRNDLRSAGSATLNRMQSQST